MGIPSKKIKMGGPITHLPYLVEFFEKNNHYEIRTFNYGSRIDAGSLINKKEKTISKLFNTLKVFLLFVYHIVVFRPHIIHINTAFDKRSLIRDIPFSVFSFLFRKKLFFKLHGSSYELIQTQNKFYLFLIKLFFLGAKQIGVLSEIERMEFIDKFKNTEKLIVVKNIVIPDKFKSKEEVRYFVRDPNKIYGLLVSRIISGKGLDDMIRALPLILMAHPNFILAIAGDGPEKNILENLATELKVNRHILWLGFVPNNYLRSVYGLSDIYIFSSHFPEGMPMSLVEALKCGIPIITTRVRFAVNYLKENLNCLFIDFGNINDIVDKIDKIICDKELKERMKLVNPKIVKKYNQEQVGKEFDNIYKKMLLH